jgi:hypothetical protein
MNDIYDYIKTEEASFQTKEVQVGDNWLWSLRNHVQMIFHLKNGMFFTGENNWLRAFKNIMEPILDLCYWTEDIDVKDVMFFIEGEGKKPLSFLLKKYHNEVYTREHDLDTLFDEITESDIDYGGVLVQKGAKRPEVLQLNSIAFCDQTDMLGGPIGLKFHFTPTKLRSLKSLGWGETKNGATISIEDLIILADSKKSVDGTMGDVKQNDVTGKTIEVYVVRGDMPESLLKDDGDEEKSITQVQVVAFYADEKGNKQGVTLYRKEASKTDLLFFASKKVYMRALGRGIGERLLGPQIWTNFLSIHKMSLLEAAAKVPLYTDDASFSQKNKIQEMENLEITKIEDGKRIFQVPTAAPANIQLYEGDINSWYSHAQLSGSAFDPIMGVQATSGTTFKGQERTVAQGRGSHDKRRGQRAKFIEQLYREFIIPDMVKEINRGTKFLADLTGEELTWISDRFATNETNRRIAQATLNKKSITPEEQAAIKEFIKGEFLKKGNRHLLKILKDEFDGIEIKVGINIAGKQKNVAELSDKLLSIFQFIFQNPTGFQQAMQIPALARSFENLLEMGNMSIGDFSSLLQAPAQVQAPVQAQSQQMQAPNQA